MQLPAYRSISCAWFLLLALFSSAFFAAPSSAQSEGKHTARSTRSNRNDSAQNSNVTASSAMGRPQYDESLFKGMHWRSVGPYRGGRVLAVTGVPGDSNTFYFGAVAGGVFRTVDGGRNWKPIFDKEAVSSVGAIAVSESDHNLIYVGTGEACIRGNISYGNGVYKSVDGGSHWEHIGLDDTQHIGALIVNPRDGNTVFVAALGHAYGSNPERGVFRTTDGGKTWQKVLYIDDKSGAIDVVFDPSNPSTLFASTWQVVRTPWSLNSGGAGSAIYKSVDNGSTWKKLSGDGLPKGNWGRSGVSVSGADGNRVYALIEAEEGGLFRSEDGGDTWKRVNDDERYRQRAWYFTHIFADPKSVDTVYVLNTGLFRSTDGGKTFGLLPAPHGDHHGLWIDPVNPNRLINGNDGGATISVDGGKNWSSVENQPTAQFYHIAADNRFPYYLYGAQQDNSSVGIASQTDEGYIGREHWYPVGGGESAYIAPDPREPNIVYAGAEDGSVTIYDHRSNKTKNIAVWPLDNSGHGASDLEHRFQWTFPLLISHHDPNVLYAGAERLFRTSDQGKTWDPISGDLTRNDKTKQQPSGGPITLDITSVEYYDTIFALAESPLNKGQIWAGTDDGLVQLTRDEGKTWQNVSSKAWPEWAEISIIEASPFDAGTAYIAIDNHRQDDHKPYIFRSTDFGKSWTSIVQGLPSGAYVHAVRQDTKNRSLLFAGTELGIFVSFNDGAQWQPLQQNLPRTPVTDMVVKDDDLAVSTNGRSFWVLDDISPLRGLKSESAAADFVLYESGPIHRQYFPEDVDRRRPVGDNPPPGALVSYYLKGDVSDEITLEITDSDGKLVRKYSSRERKDKNEQPPEWPDRETPAELLPTKAGMNRFPWNLRYESPLELPGAFYAGNGPEGPVVLPGVYKMKVSVAGKSQTTSVEVLPDPREKSSIDDLRKQFEMSMQVSSRIADLHRAILQMREVHAQMKQMETNLARDDRNKPVIDAMHDFDNRMSLVETQLMQTKMKSSEGNLRYPNMLNEEFDSFSHTIENDAAPTRSMTQVFEVLSRRLDTQLAAWKELLSAQLPALNEKIKATDATSITLGNQKGAE
ncbi:MAG: hypothetical protein ABJA69_00915 [Acidobacteriaceae bacterium]